MKNLTVGLFCVGAASAVAGTLFTSALAVALAPDVAAREEEAHSTLPSPSPPLDRARLATLMGLHSTEAEAELTSRPFDHRLRGTLSGSLALVEPVAGGRARSVRVGEQLGDATVEEIGPRDITLRRGGARERLVAQASAQPAVAENHHLLEMPKDEFERTRKGWMTLAHQLRIVPAFENGQAVGMRVAWLSKDALALRAGLQQGDIVTAINGHSLADGSGIAALAAELNSQSRFVAEVRRGGASLRLEVKSL